MKKHFLIALILLFSFSLVFSEEWKTLREKKTARQYIELAESDTYLITLAAATTYSDGTVIFYCHAGIRNKQNLVNVYENLALNLDINPNESVVENASGQINNLRHSGVIKLIKFDTEPPVYSDGYILQKSHVYCDSWIDKPLEDALKKYSK